MNQTQHKIYYKGNPYTRQNYIPYCAQKNRREKRYLVQFPQGVNYFSNSHKKQYSYLHNQSEIGQLNLFYEQPSHYHHSNLQISDIEGTNTNSLISQAVKNRIKGNHWYHSPTSEGKTHERSLSTPKTIKNENDVPKYKDEHFDKNFLCYDVVNNKKINYHLRQNKYQTKTLQNGDQIKNSNQNKSQYNCSNQIEQQIISYQYNPQIIKMPQTTQTQPKNTIGDLQQQLFIKQFNRLKPHNSPTSNYKISSSMGKQIDLKIHSQLKQKQLKQDVFKSESQRGNISQRNTTLDAMKISQMEVQKNKFPTQEIRKMTPKLNAKEKQQTETQKIKLVPTQEIRKLNPTYLSTENYIPSEHLFHWKHSLLRSKS